MYYWHKLEKIVLDKPLFVLTGDIDSTALPDEKLNILKASLQTAKRHGVPYWVFVTPNPFLHLENLCRKIKKWNKNVIIGTHGFTHKSFSKLSYQEQLTELNFSKEAFKRIGIPVFAMRTPFLSLNRNTFKAVADAGFRLDFSASFGRYATAFSFLLEPRRLEETVFVPLTTPSDTYFRNRKASWRKMASVWIEKASKILRKIGVLSFLVHPAGYEENPKALDALLQYVCPQNINVLGAETATILHLQSEAS